MTNEKEVKAVKKPKITWDLLIAPLEKAREGGMVTQVHTSATDAPQIASHYQCNANVYPSDENYAIYSTGVRVDLI